MLIDIYAKWKFGLDQVLVYTTVFVCLLSIDLETNKINTFDVGLGLERENFVLSSNFESAAGMLCFGTKDGFSWWD